MYHCDVGVERGGEGRSPVGVGEVVVEREVGFPVGVLVDSETVARIEGYPVACVCANLTEELDEGLVAHVESASGFAVPQVRPNQTPPLAA